MIKKEEMLAADLSAEQTPDAGEDERLEPREGETKTYQENLFSRIVRGARKTYFLDVRENARGKYLKLTESSPRGRSTILVSKYLLSVILSVLDDGIKSDYEPKVDVSDLDSNWVTVLSRRVMSQRKKIYVDIMQNDRGRSLNIAEVQVDGSRPKTSVVAPEGVWFDLQRGLSEVIERYPETVQNRDFVKTTPSSAPKQTDDEKKAVQISSEKLVFAGKRMFFDFLENDIGRYLKISEVRKNKRETLFLPKVCFPNFAALLTAFAEEDYERIVDGFEDREAPEKEAENHKNLARKVLLLEEEKADGNNAERTYTFDMRENSFGKFLRITEERTDRSNCVFVPSEKLTEVTEIVNKFNDLE